MPISDCSSTGGAGSPAFLGSGGTIRPPGFTDGPGPASCGIFLAGLAPGFNTPDIAANAAPERAGAAGMRARGLA